jgi:acyl carrier protein
VADPASAGPAEPAGTGSTAPPAGLAGQLRERLAETLPNYLVPSAIQVVDELPLTARGKVDRAALAKLVGRTAGTGYVAPHEGLPATLATVFARELGVERIGAQDNFFEAGATSVLIVKIHRILRQELQLDIPLMAMFEFPTVDRLAAHLAGGATVGDSAQLGFERGRRRAARRRGRPASS